MRDVQGRLLRLRDLSRGAENIRLFLDHDSGMRAAALGALSERVADRTADALLRAHQQRHDRRRAKVSRERFRALEEEHPEQDRQALRLFVIKEALADMSVIGHWKDRWLTHQHELAREGRLLPD